MRDSYPISLAGVWRRIKGYRLARHRNGGLEIVFIAKGHSVWEVEGRRYAVPPGSLFFTLPWEEHGGVEERKPGLELYFVVIKLDRDYRKGVRRFLFHAGVPLEKRLAREISEGLVAKRDRCVPATESAAWLLKRMVAEHLSAGGTERENAQRAMVAQVLVELKRCLARTGRERAEGEAEQRVRDILEMLGSKLAETWTLEKMARASGLGRTRFSEVVFHLTGDTPVLHVNRLRVEAAKGMLRETGRPITEIALACGFGSSQYFARVFRQFMTMPASVYAKAFRKPAR